MANSDPKHRHSFRTVRISTWRYVLACRLSTKEAVDWELCNQQHIQYVFEEHSLYSSPRILVKRKLVLEITNPIATFVISFSMW